MSDVFFYFKIIIISVENSEKKTIKKSKAEQFRSGLVKPKYSNLNTFYFFKTYMYIATYI